MSLEKLLREREGFKDYVYEDTMGNPTIGTGHKLPEKYRSMIYDPDKKGSKKVKPFTNKQLEEFFQEDIKIAKNSAMANFNNFNTFPVSVQEGLINQAFQLGQGKQALFTEMKKGLDSGDYNKAMVEALDSNWNTQTPKRSNDLANIFREQIPSGQEVNLVPEQTIIPLMRPSESNTVPNQNNIIMEGIKQDMNKQAVPQPKSFSQAFGEARQQQGSGGTFEWNGNSYSTNMAGEVPAVAEPMFPREEFVPTVPPRVTSTADSRINVPSFEGLEIPELGFNNGISSVPNYLEEIKSLTLAPPSMMSDIDEDQRRLQEMAIVNDVRNNYSVPPKVIDNNEIVQTELPPASVESDINQDRRNLQEMAIVNDLANKNNKEKVVPLVNNNINYTEYTTQAMTQQEAESILRDPNASEESRLNARKFFSGNFTVPSEIDNSVMTEEKAYSILQDPNASPLDTTKAQQFFGGIKPSEGRGKGEIEVAARKSLVPEIKETNTNTETKNDDTSTLPDGVTEVNLISKRQSEIDKGTPNSVKEQVGGMLQTFFGLETSDVTRAVGFYLASRAAGYSHEGSMRWAGRTVLAQSESKRKEKLAANVRKEKYDREDARFKQVDKLALSKIAATLAGNKATNESNIAKAYEVFRKGAASESSALYGSGENRLKNIPSDENISRSAVSWGMANGYNLSDASTANNFGLIYGRALQSMQQQAKMNPDKKIGTLEGFLALEQAKTWTGGVDSLWVLNPEEEDQNKFDYVGSQYIQELQEPLKKKANETGKTGNAIISELALVWDKKSAKEKKKYGNAKGRNGFYLFVKKKLG